MVETWDSGRLDQMGDERMPCHHFGSLGRQDVGNRDLGPVARVEVTERVRCTQET
jgi:hypothetical protein